MRKFSMKGWISATAEEISALARTSSIDGQLLTAVEELIARRLYQIPPAGARELAAVLAKAKTVVGSGPSAGADVLWDLAVEKALQANTYGPRLAQAFEPTRRRISKNWFELATGAVPGNDAVEVDDGVRLTRRIVVVEVLVKVPRGGAAKDAYATFWGEVLDPKRHPPMYKFNLGSRIRRVEYDEMNGNEIRALGRAREKLQKINVGE
jgi:hypothetical protein